MKLSACLILLSLFLMNCTSSNQEEGKSQILSARNVLPSEQQLEYQSLEMVGFIHFTVNTFTDKEWGFGDEDPSIFNPTALDAEQWVLAAKAGGMKELILTAKHHDGFCLWPSRFTEHSVKNSPFRNGQGDLVREFADACRKHGLKVGLYLSPWDRNHSDYGSSAYITYYRNQLTELLSNYGEINEIWFDGANGGEGYYGGANEERRIDKNTYYDWDSTIALVKELQPNIKIFSDAGPDLRWVGNEHGHAGETFWSTIDKDKLVIGASDPDYLNEGDPNGSVWITGQCDVSIRPGWFYHASQDSLVKTPEEIMDIYYKSVGRNGVFLLNLPPDQRGLIHETDVENLRQFNELLNNTFPQHLISYENLESFNTNSFIASHEADYAFDDNEDTFWAASDSLSNNWISINLNNAIEIDHLIVQEPIQYGQRIAQFEIEVKNDAGEWENLTNGTTIGYKRILKVDPVNFTELKIKILKSYGPPAISSVKFYKSNTQGI